MELIQQLKNTYTYFNKDKIIDFSTIRYCYKQLSNLVINCNRLPESETNRLVDCYILFVEHLITYVKLQGLSHTKHIHGLKKRLELLTSVCEVSNNIKQAYIISLMVSLLEIILRFNTQKWLTEALIRNLMVILKYSNKELKRTRELAKVEYLLKIFDEIRGYGDFEYQFLLIELIVTIFPDNILKLYVDSFLPDSEALQCAFLSINKNNNVPYEIRIFLNSFNVKYNKVFSFKFQQAMTDKEQILPFTDQLWVDFNISAKSLTIPCKASSFIIRKGYDTEIVKISFKDISAVELVENQLKPALGTSIFFRLNGQCVILSSESLKRDYLKLMLSDSYDKDILEKKVLHSLFKDKLQKVTQPALQGEKLENPVSEGTPWSRRFGIGKYRPLDVTRTGASYDSESYTKTLTSNKSTNPVPKTEDQQGNKNNDFLDEADYFLEEKENLQNNIKLKHDRMKFFNAKNDCSLNDEQKSDSSYEFEISKNNAAKVPQKMTLKTPNKLQMYLQQIEEFSTITADSQFNTKTDLTIKNKFPQNQNLDDVIEISDDEKNINTSTDLIKSKNQKSRAMKNITSSKKNKRKSKRRKDVEVGLTENGVGESMTQKNIFLSHISAFSLRKSPSSIFSDDSTEEMLTLESQILNSGIEFIVDGSEKGECNNSQRKFPRLSKNVLIKSDGRRKEKLDLQSEIDNAGIDGVPRFVQPSSILISAIGLIKSQNSEFSDESIDEILDLHPEIDNSDIELIADSLEKNEINENIDIVRVENKYASYKLRNISSFGLEKSQNRDCSDESADEIVVLDPVIDNSDVELVVDSLEKNEINQGTVRVENEYTFSKLRHISAFGLEKSQNRECSDESGDEIVVLDPEIDNSDVELVVDSLEKNEINQNKGTVRVENEYACSKLRRISAYGLEKSQNRECSDESADENSDVELVADGLGKNESDRSIDECSVTEKIEKKIKNTSNELRESQISVISDISNNVNVTKNICLRDNYEIGLRQSQSSYKNSEKSDGLDKDKSHCSKYGSPIIGGNGLVFSKLTNINTTEVLRKEFIDLNVEKMQSDSDNSSNEIIVDGYLGDTYVCKEQCSKDGSDDVYNNIGEARNNNISNKKHQPGNELGMKSVGRINKTNGSQTAKIESLNILESKVKSVTENTDKLNETVREEYQSDKINSSTILESAVKSVTRKNIKVNEIARNESSLNEKIKTTNILENPVKSVSDNTTKLNKIKKSKSQTNKIKTPNILKPRVKSVTKKTTKLNEIVRSQSSQSEKIKTPNIIESAVKSITGSTTNLKKTVRSDSQTENIKTPNILKPRVKSVTKKTTKLNEIGRSESSQSEKIKTSNIIESAVKSITGSSTNLKKTVTSDSQTENIKYPNILESVAKLVPENTDKVYETVRSESSPSEKIKTPNIIESAVQDIFPENQTNSFNIKKRKLDVCEENNFVTATAKRLKSVNSKALMSVENDANLLDGSSATASKYLEIPPNVRSETITPLSKENINTNYCLNILELPKENTNKNIPKKINVLQHIIIKPSKGVPAQNQSNVRRTEPEIIPHTPHESNTESVGSIKINKKFLSFVRSYATQMNIPLHDDCKQKFEKGLNRSLNNNYADLSKAMATFGKSGKNKSAETRLEKVIKEILTRNNDLYKLLQEKLLNNKIQDPHLRKLLLVLKRLTYILSTYLNPNN